MDEIVWFRLCLVVSGGFLCLGQICVQTCVFCLNPLISVGLGWFGVVLNDFIRFQQKLF